MHEHLLPTPTVANISFVTPRLAVGGDLSYDEGLAEGQVAELVELGVTHIVDARIEWNDQNLVARLAPAIAYLHHGMDDAGQRVPDSWFEEGLSWIGDALTDPDAIILTHCHMGINRGPSLGFATLLALGWGPTDALSAIVRVRPIAGVGYAEDALRWHHHRTDTPPATRRADQRAVARWRKANDIDVESIIRGLR